MPILDAQEAYPPQRLAQKLNNRAVLFMDLGEYQAAAQLLVKGLKATEQLLQLSGRKDSSRANRNNQSSTCPCVYCSLVTGNVQTSTCPCLCCSLDYCMSYSNNFYLDASSKQKSSEHFVQKKPERGRGEYSEKFVESGYIYRQAIRIAPQSIEEGHNMGIVLPLIMTFNLALANHLSILQDMETPLDRQKLQRVLRLYELTYRWQMEEKNSQVDSIQFSLAISNNLGEIHRAVSNHDKHKKCLQHLLSTLMYIVDSNKEYSSSDERSVIECNDTVIEGFFSNASGLILIGNCAEAA